MSRAQAYKSVAVFALCLSSIFAFAGCASAATTWYANAATGNDTTGTGTSGNPYKSMSKAYAAASAGDTLDLTGTFSWSTEAGAQIASTTGFTIAKNITIQGHGTANTIIEAGISTSSASSRVLTINSGTTVSISGADIRYGKVTGSYYAGGIYNMGTLTITNSNIDNNYNGSYIAGGIDNQNTLTVTNSSIFNNYGYSNGAGIENDYTISAGGYLTLTNDTFYGNREGATSGVPYGGAILVRGGGATITNNTIVGNYAYMGGGIAVYTSGAINVGTTTLENNIISGNTATVASSYNDFYTSSSAVVDNGYNIVGQSSGTTFTATGDWTDQSNTGTYTLHGSATTGTVNLDPTGPGLNDNPNGPFTYALLANSIAIDAGTTTANGATSTVPTLDERGAGRAGAGTDIGAFEYNGTGLAVSTPTVQATSVTFGTVYTNQMTLNWTPGNGSRRVVFVEAGSSGSASPSNGTQYAASSVFGSGSQIGSSGWYAVYDGVGASVTVTGLTAATNYTFDIIEYNGVTTGTQQYFTATASGNPATQQSHVPTTIYANASTGSDTTGTGSSGNPYKSMSKAYAAASQTGDTLDLTGVFSWATEAGAQIASTTGFTIAKNITIQGHGPGITSIQAGTATTTSSSRVLTIAASTTVAISSVEIKNGYLNGSSYYGAGIENYGTLTINNSNIDGNYNASGVGGGLDNYYLMTITNSALFNNYAYSQGGGIENDYYGTYGMYLTMTNDSVFGNYQGSTIATVFGAGIAVRGGSATLTNLTITNNRAYFGGGLGVYTTGSVVLENSILSGNTATYTSAPGGGADYYYISGTSLIDNGYNIIGQSSTGTTTAAGDWSDQYKTGTYKLYGSSTTGTVNLDPTGPGLNNNPNGTYTYALLPGSIAINAGTTTANGATSTVPTSDQRGATRNGAPDIGAFEYNGGGVAGAGPVISSVASSTTYSTATIAWTTDTAASSTVNYGGNSAYGSASTSAALVTSHSVVLTGLTAATLYHFQVAGADGSGNLSTSTDYTFMTSAAPDVAPASVVATPAANGATITWTTGTSASSRIWFGPTSNFATSTPELDTSPRVTSHSVVISGLPACAAFMYVVTGRDSGGTSATSSVQSFFTTGCTGSASVTANNAGYISAGAGGTLSQGNVSLIVPTGFTSTSTGATFEANQLDRTAFFAAAGAPAGLTAAGSDVFNLKSLIDASTTLPTFAAPLTVTLAYTLPQISGLDPASLKIYRYDGSVWNALAGCSTNTSAQTVTCTTNNFSDFAIFGTPLASNSSGTLASPIATGGGQGALPWCSGPAAPGWNASLPNGGCTGALTASSSSATTASVMHVQSTGASYHFARDLQVGMSGKDVAALQRSIIAAGFRIPSGPTGYFGTQTRTALAALQKAHGITPAAGYFGPKTKAYLAK